MSNREDLQNSIDIARQEVEDAQVLLRAEFKTPYALVLNKALSLLDESLRAIAANSNASPTDHAFLNGQMFALRSMLNLPQQLYDGKVSKFNSLISALDSLEFQGDALKYKDR